MNTVPIQEYTTDNINFQKYKNSEYMINLVMSNLFYEN